MKKLIIASMLILLAGTLAGQQPGTASISNRPQDQLVTVSTANTHLIYRVSGRDGRLYQAYLGKKLSSPDAILQSRTRELQAYPGYGAGSLFEPAIRITHNDGNPSLDLIYRGYTTDKPDANRTNMHIMLSDTIYNVNVTLHITAFSKEDVIEQWTEIVHNEAKPVTIFLYASSMLNFDAGSYWLAQFHGDWAEEMKSVETQLTSGIKIIDTKLGTRAHMYQTPVFMLSLNGKAGENEGDVVAGTLGWSGNFQFMFEIDELNTLRIRSGINPFASEYMLYPRKSFKTPSFIFTFSSTGKGAASRNLHAWARNYGLLDGNGQRMTLLNNWETTYFDFNEQKLAGLLDDTKKMGLDVFLLDDGWFANKYPRNNDMAGLGDWQENKAKLPNGLGYLVKEADAKGVKFGIWIEPEMVNPKSELYEKHPEWVLKFPNRQEVYYRNQLVLDLSNPEVMDFVYSTVDGMLTKYPGIAFIKWDCNSMIMNPYSAYLKDRQSHLYVDYVNNLYSVLEKLRKKYPRLPVMLCSGGGGRVDYGALKYFTEFWASDNTDPLERIYIQWGYSYFFPSVSVCNHITSWGKQSLKFRTDVAMMGKMGYDIQVNELNEKELKFSQDAIANYRRLSEVIWKGDLYRLVSPYESDRAVLMYVNESKTKAVLFAYTLNARYGETFGKVRLQGLDPAKTYRIQEINIFSEARRMGPPDSGRSYSGDYLMKIGINAGSPTPLTSAVYEISE
ncbi:MAG: alpha-galactosidase [Bacteroidales bacterium]|jgi:alpha-galactosidase|nr:alpha-galactosidase [Bacteroidales bacterium]MCU0408543.1 alpha-galactosidase [Bacteroidales bacterium]